MKEIDRNLLKTKKKMLLELVVLFLIIFCLILRLGYLQIIDGARLKKLAIDQQSLGRIIGAKRGTIYDSTEKNILAISSTVESVTINPKNIKKEDKQKVAKALSEILDLDYEKMVKKVNRRSSIENIKKRIEKEEADKLRKWCIDNNILKRYKY